MHILIVSKSELTSEQLLHIGDRINVDMHRNDIGPNTVWNTYQNGLYAAIDKKSGSIVGLIEASGPDDGVNPGWWVDSDFRNRGAGRKIVIELAKYLKKNGYTGVGEIRIVTFSGKYDEASLKLKSLFIKTFEKC